MNKLPAAGAILAIAALAAAAPAAQGRRVIVAVERDGHSPAGGVLSGTLPDGSPTYLVKTPRGTTARAFAHKLGQRRGVIAAQVDRPFWLHPAPQAPAGCIDKPSDPSSTRRRRPTRSRSTPAARPSRSRSWTPGSTRTHRSSRAGSCRTMTSSAGSPSPTRTGTAPRSPRSPQVDRFRSRRVAAQPGPPGADLQPVRRQLGGDRRAGDHRGGPERRRRDQHLGRGRRGRRQRAGQPGPDHRDRTGGQRGGDRRRAVGQRGQAPGGAPGPTPMY